MNPQLNSALNYAKDNFKVFPLKVNSKSGQVSIFWKEEATTNVNQIYQWFSNTDFNVGVRTSDDLGVIEVSHYFISMNYPIAQVNEIVYKFLEGVRVLSKTQIDSTKIKKKQMRSR